MSFKDDNFFFMFCNIIYHGFFFCRENVRFENVLAVPRAFGRRNTHLRIGEDPTVLQPADQFRGGYPPVRGEDTRLHRTLPRRPGSPLPIRLPRTLRAQAGLQVTYLNR